MWRLLGSPERIEILELGPGRGLFAQDVLDWSQKKFPEFFEAVHYSLVERSSALRERLKHTLDRHFRIGRVSLTQGLAPSFSNQLDGSEGVHFCEEVPRNDPRLSETGNGTTSVVPLGRMFQRALAPEVPIVIFANEFFDALPVEILSPEGELCVAEKDGRFVETWVPASTVELDFLDHYSMHPEPGERVEVPLIAQEYMSAIAAGIKQGITVIIDYGYTRHEQLAGRHRGTVTAYRQHSVSANPYEAPGEQDITAHVNFTALSAAAESKRMHVQPLVTQSQFLLGIGEKTEFADAFEECRLPQERAKVALQLKHLVTPAGMGESFQVLVASKGVEPEKVALLSGLSFGRSLL
jgi:SAM-dependent MidA family methyltransferase